HGEKVADGLRLAAGGRKPAKAWKFVRGTRGIEGGRGTRETSNVRPCGGHGEIAGTTLFSLRQPEWRQLRGNGSPAVPAAHGPLGRPDAANAYQGRRRA